MITPTDNMENVTVDILTNQTVITTSQPLSGVCKTWMITAGVLGGIPICIVTAFLIFIIFYRKRISEVILSPWKYDTILALMAIVSTGVSVTTVINLFNNCMEYPVENGWIVIACIGILSAVASLTIPAYLKYCKDYYEREVKVQQLRNHIENAKRSCDKAKTVLNNIKDENLIDEAEKKEKQLQDIVKNWKDNIKKAVELKKELQDARKKNGEPLLSEALENQIQKTRPKDEDPLLPGDFQYIQYLENAIDLEGQHDNNIDGFSHEAFKEIEYKKKVQQLRKHIENTKRSCDKAKAVLNNIKDEHLIGEAEKKEKQLQDIVKNWKDAVEEAVELKKELQDARKKNGEPLLSEALENEIQKTRPKDEDPFFPGNFQYIHYLENALDFEGQHDNNIDGFSHEASKEIEYKKKGISQGLLESWKEEDKIFYATKATEYIYNEAKKKQKLILKGRPGVGKSANVHHIALRLKDEGYRLFCVKSVKEMIKVIDELDEDEVKQVYVFDDVFGVHSVVEENRKGWSDENKDDLERCLNKAYVIILCTSRLRVIKDDKLSSIKSRFTIINMSGGENELSDNERVEIFKKHAIANQRYDLLKDGNQLKDTVSQKIPKLECPLGCFPLVCRLYTGDKETKQAIEEYFSEPLKVIAELLDNLRTEEPIRYFCLLMCLIYDNKLPVDTIELAYESEHDEKTKQLREEFLKLCELSISTSLKTIKDRMDTLLQTFVKLEGDTYRFVHDFIHDAVMRHISNLSPDSDVSPSEHKVILRHCSSRFIANRVHLFGSECKNEYGGSGHDTESCINIRRDVFPLWARRVLELIQDGQNKSDQLYNDISEGRCKLYDPRVLWDNPWFDIFKNNHCVRSTEGDTAIAQILAGKSPSDVRKIMCKSGYSAFVFEPTDRHTALHWILRYGLTHTALQTLSMISQGQLQELNTMDNLLYLACEANCNTNVIQALIDSGLNINTPDVDGLTPLCKSVINNEYKITKLLLDSGAFVNQCNVYSKSALYWSQLLEYDTITKLLKSYGAVCLYKGTEYNHITGIPDSQLDEWERKTIQKLKKELLKHD